MVTFRICYLELIFIFNIEDESSSTSYGGKKGELQFSQIKRRFEGKEGKKSWRKGESDYIARCKYSRCVFVMTKLVVPPILS